jgi:RNA polymerase sigma-70 factor (ECF subfamily)
MIELRLDRRLRGRLDASDVVQDAFLEAVDRLDKYLSDRSMPFFIWLRFLTGQKLTELHRRHLGVQARAVNREVSLYQAPMPEASSAALAAQLLGRWSSPSAKVVKAELQLQLEGALNAMTLVDREVLVLRHFEQLSNVETAYVLGISENAASNRYVRALKRLKEMLDQIPGFFDDL